MCVVGFDVAVDVVVEGGVLGWHLGVLGHLEGFISTNIIGGEELGH